MNLILFIGIWVVVFVVLISFIPAILYWLSLTFNWFKPKKKIKRDPNYPISNLKIQRGFVR
ncbi:hypothetical protein KY311_01920 [Candidatus Woesearchaeota archaeon]|nr:hypothetical protein [Candidatus Woesearchaeota archaeon]